MPVLRVRALPAAEAAALPRPPGVPFLRKVTLFRQTTVYESHAVRATLEIGRRAGGKLEAVSVDQATVAPKSPALAALRAELERQSARQPASRAESDASRAAVVAAFAALARAAVDPAVPSRPQLVANALERASVADPGTVYYLNARLPWFGSGQVATKLAADGTLTEAAGEGKSELGAGLAALLPVKELLTAKLLPPAPQVTVKADGEPPPPEAWEFRLTVESVGYRFAFTREHAAPPAALAPLPFDLEHEQFTRTALDGPPAGAKADDKKTIKFEGDVEMPEP